MFGKQALTSKTSQFSEGAKKIQSGEPILEHRKEEKASNTMVINRVKIQWSKDKLGDLMAMVSKETSKMKKNKKNKKK